MPESDQPQHGFSMADVAAKPVTYRLALASGKINVGEKAFRLLRDKSLPKGDALALAEFAGIQAAKQTPSLIPLCHPISLNRVSIHTRLSEEISRSKYMPWPKSMPKPVWKWKHFAA